VSFTHTLPISLGSFPPFEILRHYTSPSLHSNIPLQYIISPHPSHLLTHIIYITHHPLRSASKSRTGACNTGTTTLARITRIRLAKALLIRLPTIIVAATSHLGRVPLLVRIPVQRAGGGTAIGIPPGRAGPRAIGGILRGRGRQLGEARAGLLGAVVGLAAFEHAREFAACSGEVGDRAVVFAGCELIVRVAILRLSGWGEVGEVTVRIMLENDTLNNTNTISTKINITHGIIKVHPPAPRRTRTRRTGQLAQTDPARLPRIRTLAARQHGIVERTIVLVTVRQRQLVGAPRVAKVDFVDGVVKVRFEGGVCGGGCWRGGEHGETLASSLSTISTLAARQHGTVSRPPIRHGILILTISIRPIRAIIGIINIQPPAVGRTRSRRTGQLAHAVPRSLSRVRAPAALQLGGVGGRVAVDRVAAFAAGPPLRVGGMPCRGRLAVGGAAGLPLIAVRLEVALGAVLVGEGEFAIGSVGDGELLEFVGGGGVRWLGGDGGCVGSGLLILDVVLEEGFDGDGVRAADEGGGG